MDKKVVKIKEVKFNETNPRVIKDEKFKKLVKSIQEFPQMLSIRPIVVNKDMIVLGGNMRLKACIEAGFKEIPILMADNLTEEQEKQFIIKDNVGFGEWDWDILANEWNTDLLNDWGLDVWKANEDIDLNNFFEDVSEDSQNQKFKIVLEYTEEDYALINEAFKKYSGTKEKIIADLLGI